MMGPMLLFTGYRSPDCDLFVEEKSAMVASGILDYAFLALSRHPTVPKVAYVKSDLILKWRAFVRACVRACQSIMCSCFFVQ